MINTYFSAKVFDYNTIKVFIFSDVQKPIDTKIKLVTNDSIVESLEIVKQSFINGLELYECRCKEMIVLGKEYYISIESFGITPLIMDDVTGFPDFDDKYYYDGNDLGFTYSKEETTWKLWAPLASKVVLLIKKDDGFLTYKMERGDKGVYSITLMGDFDGYKYRFQVTNSGLTIQTTDPYAKASTANGHDSCVVDFNKTQIDMHDSSLPFYKDYVETILYELHIRDFTIDNHTNIKNKGKFLGIVEEGRTTVNGNPAGLDYLKSLNITHVQLLPIYDFKTVDELNPESSYNWGYDPAQYFVPEGSYATDPNDPYSRIIECKQMISEFHKANLKVNMDVVYNHVYLYDRSVFEAIVPNYFFRKQRSGLLSTASGCGNELDTKRPMVRKLIIDSCKHWIEEYHVDGFRFDLMGLIDIETIKLIVNMAREHKKDFMVYGEGWNMDSSLPESERATILNSFKIPQVAFFNDSFRDIVRGPNGFGSSKEAGYLLGNVNYVEGFKFVLLGSSSKYCFPARFTSANQSINYVECHDNATLYDKIKLCLPHKNDVDIIKIINSTNAAIAVSFGIPFFHAGQEIGLTKYGFDNTYNKGDKYNKFDWSVLDKRFEMYLFFKSLLKLRRSSVCVADPKIICSHNLFINYNDGILGFKVSSFDGYDDDYLFIFNPTDNDISICLDDYYKVFLAMGGYLENSDVYTQNETIISHQVEGLVKIKNEKIY